MKNKVNPTLKKGEIPLNCPIMQLEDFQIEGDKITEEQLEALYIYLSMSYDTMTKEEKGIWYEIMQKIDKEFYDY